MSRAKNIVRSFVPRAVRNWLRSPATSARWAWDEIKFSTGLRTIVQMRPGWSVVCHPAAYRCAYFAQHDDPEQVAEFDGFISNSSQGMLLFDIGAHFGLFSLAALHYGGPRAQSIAIDPSPTAARFISMQARLNRSADRLRVVQAAVGDRTGKQSMIAVGVLASGYYVAPTKEHTAGELSQTVKITIDSLIAELDVNPTHIKIDVEGYEAAVLRGGRKILSGALAPLLFIELHNQMVSEAGGDPAETLLVLRGYGYETFTSDGRAIGETEILSEPLIRLMARKPLPFSSEVSPSFSSEASGLD